MNIIVVGCGRLGVELAAHLYKKGHHVTVVDLKTTAFDKLPSDFHGRTIEGNALNQDVIRRAGIETADAIAVMTSFDPLNLAIGHMARKVFNILNVVVRNYDPVSRPLFEAFGLNVVSSTSWGAQRVEELLHDPDLRAVFTAGNGEVEIYEFIVPEALAGKTVKEVLGPCEDVVVVSLTRAGVAALPTPDWVLQTEDVIHASATFKGMQAVRERINHLKEVHNA